MIHYTTPHYTHTPVSANASSAYAWHKSYLFLHSCCCSIIPRLCLGMCVHKSERVCVCVCVGERESVCMRVCVKECARMNIIHIRIRYTHTTHRPVPSAASVSPTPLPTPALALESSFISTPAPAVASVVEPVAGAKCGVWWLVV
jgi:hypothetical protein